MSISGGQILREVVNEYSELKVSYNLRKSWIQMSEKELWEELCICILSSNVPYELALSAFYHLRNHDFLAYEKIAANPNVAQEIAFELSRRIFLPRRKDGSGRKYRFPNVRSRDIAKAAVTLYIENKGLVQLLENSNSEAETRDFLAKYISGIGLKEASHFLRNIGFSNSLAIVDTHIITFLEEVGAIHESKTKTVTPRAYIEMERKLQSICSNLGVGISLFDMAIWRYMRGKTL
jgi:N-glycosylase/DNA lyase